MKFKNSLFLSTALFSLLCFSQQPSTNADVVEKALQQKNKLTQNSLVKNIVFENIGPTVMSGRVTDVDVNPNDPTEFYVAYASGGVWHTTNNGSTFTPILDNANTQNVGDIAVDWNNKTIWLVQEKIIALVHLMLELEF